MGDFTYPLKVNLILLRVYRYEVNKYIVLKSINGFNPKGKGKDGQVI